MTNEKAIAQLREILATERKWKEYYSASVRMADRVRQGQFKKASLRTAALEHAITELGVLQMRTGEL